MVPSDFDELFHIDCFQNSVFEEGKGSEIQMFIQDSHQNPLIPHKLCVSASFESLQCDATYTVRNGSLISGKDDSMPL